VTVVLTVDLALSESSLGSLVTCSLVQKAVSLVWLRQVLAGLIVRVVPLLLEIVENPIEIVALLHAARGTNAVERDARQVVSHHRALRQGEGNEAEQRREHNEGNSAAKSVGSGMLHRFLLTREEHDAEKLSALLSLSMVRCG
jgi:hypothetical protein